jgi:hypothetical protein
MSKAAFGGSHPMKWAPELNMYEHHPTDPSIFESSSTAR